MATAFPKDVQSTFTLLKTTNTINITVTEGKLFYYQTDFAILVLRSSTLSYYIVWSCIIKNR